MTAPAGHLIDAQKLTGDGKVDLFRIDLNPSGTMYLKNNNAVTWQGNLYEEWSIRLTGVGDTSDGENKRPKMEVANSDAIYSALIAQGLMDDARITRIRILLDDLTNDRDIKQTRTWRVSRCMSLNRSQASFELRGELDGAFFIVPARVYAPPLFPQVSLS